jgi:hypothetical protein
VGAPTVDLGGRGAAPVTVEKKKERASLWAAMAAVAVVVVAGAGAVWGLMPGDTDGEASGGVAATGAALLDAAPDARQAAAVAVQPPDAGMPDAAPPDAASPDAAPQARSRSTRRTRYSKPEPKPSTQVKPPKPPQNDDIFNTRN